MKVKCERLSGTLSVLYDIDMCQVTVQNHRHSAAVCLDVAAIKKLRKVLKRAQKAREHLEANTTTGD